MQLSSALNYLCLCFHQGPILTICWSLPRIYEFFCILLFYSSHVYAYKFHFTENICVHFVLINAKQIKLHQSFFQKRRKFNAVTSVTKRRFVIASNYFKKIVMKTSKSKLSFTLPKCNQNVNHQYNLPFLKRHLPLGIMIIISIFNHTPIYLELYCVVAQQKFLSFVSRKKNYEPVFARV